MNINEAKNKYILAVYIGFIFQLLTVIFSMLICEKFSCLRLLSIDELHSKFYLVFKFTIVLILINAIIEWFWIDKNKGNIALISFYLLSLLCENFFYGVILAFMDLVTKSIGIPSITHIIQYAFCITTVIFIVITIWAFFSKEKNYDHPVLNYCFVGTVVVGIFNMYWGWTWLDIVIDIISIVLVSFFIYFDTIKIKQHAKKAVTYSKKVGFLNVLKDASDIYLDFLVIWSDIADLMLESKE